MALVTLVFSFLVKFTEVVGATFGAYEAVRPAP